MTHVPSVWGLRLGLSPQLTHHLRAPSLTIPRRSHPCPHGSLFHFVHSDLLLLDQAVSSMSARFQSVVCPAVSSVPRTGPRKVEGRGKEIDFMMILKHVAEESCVLHWTGIYFLFKHLKKSQ